MKNKILSPEEWRKENRLHALYEHSNKNIHILMKQYSDYVNQLTEGKSEEINIKMTKVEFKSIMSMIDDNAVSVGSADDEFVIILKRNIKIANKMLKRNNINRKITF